MGVLVVVGVLVVMDGGCRVVAVVNFGFVAGCLGFWMICFCLL